MIKGIGVDIIEISRLKKITDKWGNKALKKIFTDNELKYCNSVKNKFHSLGVRFAAKEAVLKAIGMGLDKGISCKDIEIIKLNSGKPEVKLAGKIKNLFRKLKLSHIGISLSHSDNFAVAFVIVENKVGGKI